MRTLLALIALFALGAASPSNEPKLPLPTVPGSAASISVLTGAGDQVEARLLFAPSSNDVGARLGVLFDLSPGWHLYWKNPGDSGIATQLDWTAEDIEVGESVWPAPNSYAEADGLLTTYGYDGQVLLTAPITRRTSNVSREGREIVHDDIQALACRTECIPVALTLPRVLPGQVDPMSRLHFARHDERLPGSAVDAGIGLTATLEQNVAGEFDYAKTINALLGVRSCTNADTPQADCIPYVPIEGSIAFIPDADDSYTFSLAGRRVLESDERAGSSHFGLEIVGEADIDDARPPSRLRGVLAIQRAGEAIRRIDVDVPLVSHTSVTSATTPASVPAGGLWKALLLALLGGLILNGMPCVLPVLAIKVFAIGEMAQQSRREIVSQGLAYGFGVVGSMIALAALVVGLRSAGNAVGWGFQFQEPVFVVAICVVLVGFALNLFGVFEIELGTGRLASIGSNASGNRRSFFEGLLAVALATPCSAPFLGTAVGFAFASSALTIFAIFFCIGLGLALPFLAVSFVPGLSRLIPRSGPWMLKLRAGLAFSLLATVVWLFYVLGQTASHSAIITLLGFLVALSFGLWVHGQLQSLQRTRVTAVATLMLLTFALVGVNTIRSQIAAPGAEAAVQSSDDRWQTYDPGVVREVVESGRPAFVVFTAEWCITCKVNENIVLNRAEVSAATSELDIALFKADWTRRDETIRLELLRFGRAGVPLYLVYTGGAPNSPRILSELLTVNDVIGALTAAAQPIGTDAG